MVLLVNTASNAFFLFVFIRAIRCVSLSFRRDKLLLSTNCRQFKSVLGFDSGFHLKPVIAGIGAVRQSSHDIHYGKNRVSDATSYTRRIL